MDTNRTVALVNDGELFDDVVRLAAAAGCEVERVPDVAAIRLRWRGAPLVVLDTAGARACREQGLCRRASVVVVSGEPPPLPVWRDALELGAERVVTLPDGQDWLIGALADVAEAPAGTTGRVLAVVGGRGGAGASVFAASVGLTVLRGGRTGILIDCDPLGGGLDLVFGAEAEVGLRWPDMKLKAGRVAASALHSALPGRAHGDAHLAVLSGAREGTVPEPDAVAAVLEAGRRAGQTVICDLPRSLGDSAHAALERADLTVIVAPAEVRASASTKLVARQLVEGGTTPQLIVRGPAPGGLRPEEVADAAGIELLTTMRPEPFLATSLEHGDFRPRLRGPLATAARITLRALADQPGRELRRAS